MSRWIAIEVERALYVDRGRDAILCDRQIVGEQGGTLVLRVSDEALRKLRIEGAVGASAHQ
jgi:hypothetical protein